MKRMIAASLVQRVEPTRQVSSRWPRQPCNAHRQTVEKFRARPRLALKRRWRAAARRGIGVSFSKLIVTICAPVKAVANVAYRAAGDYVGAIIPSKKPDKTEGF